MPTATPVLSIAVPTYRHGEFLTPLIESIAAAAEGLNVEVVVSNNNSPDDTQKILDALNRQYQFLRVFKNDETTQADENMARAFDACTGSYVWCVGSDDLVTVGSIRAILHEITSAPVSVVVANWLIGDADCRPLRRALGRRPRPTVPPRRALPALGVAATFMTAVVLPRELAAPLVGRYRHGAGLMVWKVAVELLAAGTAVQYVADPVAIQRVATAPLPYNFVDVICRTTEEFLVDLAARTEGDGRTGVLRLRKKLLRALVARFVASARLRTPGVAASWWEGMRQIYRGNPAFWIWVVPLYFLPTAVFQRSYRLLRGVSRLIPS